MGADREDWKALVLVSSSHGWSDVMWANVVTATTQNSILTINKFITYHQILVIVIICNINGYAVVAEMIRVVLFYMYVADLVHDDVFTLLNATTCPKMKELWDNCFTKRRSWWSSSHWQNDIVHHTYSATGPHVGTCYQVLHLLLLSVANNPNQPTMLKTTNFRSFKEVMTFRSTIIYSAVCRFICFFVGKHRSMTAIVLQTGSLIFLLQISRF